MSKFFSFKDKNEIHELTLLHPYALVVFAELVRYCHDSSMPAPIITSLLRTSIENEADGAETDTHVKRRAFDISSKPYTKAQIDSICNHFNSTGIGKIYGAMNEKGQVRLAVYHKVEGGAFHFHFQIAKRYELEPFTGDIK